MPQIIDAYRLPGWRLTLPHAFRLVHVRSVGVRMFQDILLPQLRASRRDEKTAVLLEKKVMERTETQ